MFPSLDWLVEVYKKLFVPCGNRSVSFASMPSLCEQLSMCEHCIRRDMLIVSNAIHLLL